MNLKLFHPSGGAQYHFRALMNRKRWQPFCQYVESWLLDWRKQSKVAKATTLVLIGPNAGYTLSPLFVSSFQNVIVVEPDPIAFALFEARFNCSARWVHQDYFDLKNKVPNPDEVRKLFYAIPGAAFLFCNILGQLPVILREKKNVDVESYMTKLGAVLRSMALEFAIASYHDRYSKNLRKPDEVVDHLTGDLFLNSPDKKEFPWNVTGRVQHQIEFYRS